MQTSDVDETHSRESVLNLIDSSSHVETVETVG